MLWLCLLACERLPLLQADPPAARELRQASLAIEQAAEGAAVSIEPGASDGGVVVTDAADAEGRAVSIVSQAPAWRPAGRAGAYRTAGRPVRLGRAMLTSGFGLRYHPVYGGERFHQGIDLAAPWGAPVYSPGEGVVSAAGWHGGYGLLVALNHSRGMQTRYGHMSRLSVSPGQYVRKGELLGYIGSTGVSTGPHLHYEVRLNGVALNPLPH